ncbi:hypothetical protein PHET_02314 [Paragonimus heterotremus]|uniref:Uncharacterized protein n=1 Tax=Paragonimus heterotremus TaxID=100268 RepID=A0A8J4WTU0_9TREM|nr:hypothetical protein PHET_02314 [Paragonimus heterotremus]
MKSQSQDAIVNKHSIFEVNQPLKVKQKTFYLLCLICILSLSLVICFLLPLCSFYTNSNDLILSL